MIQPSSRRDFVRVGLGAALASSTLLGQEKTWTVGIIGDSDAGGYGHGLDRVWLNLPETKVVGVSDPSEKGRTEAVSRLGLEPGQAFADERAMLEKTRPEIVAVCPRHIGRHADRILTAIESGARGIYVEKPFCRDLVEADRIVEACRDSGAKLAIAHRNRYHPVLPVIARLVEEGAIGRWLEIRARGKEDARGGALDLWVLGSHLLNLTHYFTGTVLDCSAIVLKDGRSLVAADIADGAEGIGPLGGNEIHARFSTERGIPVFFDSIANAGTRDAGFGLQLIGTEGIIDLRIDVEPLAHYCQGSPFRPSLGDRKWVPLTSGGIGQPEPKSDIRDGVGGHQYAARDLLAAITADREPLCSAADGRTIVEMILAVFASHRLNGVAVSLPLAERKSPLADWA